VRINRVLKSVMGLNRDVVITGWELTETDDGASRPKLEVRVRLRNRRRGPCGRCGTLSPRYDQGDGERRWRHIDVGYATCELIADAPRVNCAVHGATVVAFPFACHDSAFTAALEDVVVHDAVVSNKQAAADRYGLSWRAVNHACIRLAEEALARTALLDGVVAVATDEVKYERAALPHGRV
jgi:transposase